MEIFNFAHFAKEGAKCTSLYHFTNTYVDILANLIKKE